MNIEHWHFEEELSVDEISENYSVDPKKVEAAIQYIENNPKKIEQIKEENKISEKASQERARKRMQELLK